MLIMCGHQLRNPSKKGIRNHLAVVSFAYNSQQRVRFDMQYAYVRLVRSY